MDNWKNILTFTYSHEAHLVKGKLESEGIPVQIRDELTAQVNLYSNAIGGIKLLVHEKNFDRALKILIESGQLKESEQTENIFLNRFDKISSEIPLIGKTIIELRLIIIVTFLLMIIASFVIMFLS